MRKFKQISADAGTTERMNSVSAYDFAPNYGIDTSGKVSVRFFGPSADTSHRDSASVLITFEAGSKIVDPGVFPPAEKEVIRKGKIDLPTGFILELVTKALIEKRYRPDEEEIRCLLLAIATSMDVLEARIASWEKA